MYKKIFEFFRFNCHIGYEYPLKNVKITVIESVTVF